MPHDVFISYSSHDKMVADAICSKLENNNIRCWIAPRDILPGIEYGESIIDAIAGCQVSVLIFSSKANDSPQVRREIERAVSKGKVIIPFRIEDILPTKSMEYALSNTHWLDAMTPPLEAHISKLTESIHQLLKIQSRTDNPESKHIDIYPFQDGLKKETSYNKEIKTSETKQSLTEKQNNLTESIKEVANQTNAEKEVTTLSFTSTQAINNEKNTSVSAFKTITNKKDGTQLVLISEGEFLAGGQAENQGGCLSSIYLPSYYLAVYPVTNAQYMRFLSESRPGLEELRKWINPQRLIRKAGSQFETLGFKDDHPVTEVSWVGAEAYCEWAGLRLPTELEWEKGAKGTDGRYYPWGNSWDNNKCRSYNNKGDQLTCSVKDYPEDISPWGLRQMAGNVREWCADWYDASAYNRYREGDLSSPKNNENNRRVSRGGSFAYSGGLDCFSCSGRFYSGASGIDCGFRCAKDP